MYALIHGLLADRGSAAPFTCFGPWHIRTIIGAAVIAALVLLLTKNGSRAREKAASVFTHIAFGLYIADFFLMPFAYEQIDMEKLPFHVCTAMCVMCFLSRHVRFLEKYRANFALLGFVSNLVYLIYPAGVMWYRVDPLCYRVVQTLTFHAMMTVGCLLTLVADGEGLSAKSCRRDLAVLAGMTLWAVLGNALYNGAAGSYDHRFNWFFVTGDPFGILDRSIAPYVMPFLNIAIFFAAELLVRAVLQLLRPRSAHGSGTEQKKA
ncbi:MAG: YwaF family protein [Oscillospiraceae bacterium]|nr:YwaF family protein [Oscillospiraceae bacterium]